MTASTAVSGRFRRNLRWQFVANGAQAVLGGAYLLMLGRMLGATEFGLFSTVSAFVSVAGVLFELRLQDVVARRLHQLGNPGTPSSESGQRIIDLLLLEFASRLAPVAVLVLLAPLLIQATQSPPQTSALVLIAALGYVVAKTGNSVATGMLRLYGRTDTLAACLSSDWALRLVLTALFLLAGSDLQMVFWIAAAVGGVTNLVLLRQALMAFKIRSGTLAWSQWSWLDALARLRGDRRLLLSNVGISWTDLMAKDADIAVLAPLLTAEKIGIYKMAKSFVQVIWRAIDPFYLALMPEIQRLWMRTETTALRQLILKVSAGLLLLAGAATAAAYAIGIWWIEPLLGPSYAEVPALMLLMSTWVVCCAPLLWGLPLAIAVDRPEIAVIGNAAGTGCGFTAFAMLATPLGIYGAAIGWAVSLIVGFTATAAFAALAARHKAHA